VYRVEFQTHTNVLKLRIEIVQFFMKGNTTSPAFANLPKLDSDRSKGYSCCKPRVLEFEQFLQLQGCSKNKHLFIGMPKEQEVRSHLFQIGNSRSHVLVDITRNDQFAIGSLSNAYPSHCQHFWQRRRQRKEQDRFRTLGC